jgi:hypothetical protein
MSEEKYARYENGWYFCWLIERREEGQSPEWLTAHGTWTREADRAAWFARQADADMRAIFVQNKPYSLPMAKAAVVACEHGFEISSAKGTQG